VCILFNNVISSILRYMEAYDLMYHYQLKQRVTKSEKVQ